MNSILNIANPTISSDETAILGRNGYVFLYRGTNNFIDQYDPKNYDANLGLQWQRVFSNRSIEAEKRNVTYIQMFIPEKSSVACHLSPFTTQGPTVLYVECVTAAKKQLLPHTLCLDGDNILTKAAAPEMTFQILDSHLSTYGAKLLFDAIIKHSSLNDNAAYNQLVISYTYVDKIGDLSSKFVDGALPLHKERTPFISELTFAGNELSCSEISRSMPPDGKHLGTRVIYKSETAPLNKRVVCFGNSFFGTGVASFQMSWWMARFFSEYHFCWTPEIDWQYVDLVRADIVVGQTIERFLVHCPLR